MTKDLELAIRITAKDNTGQAIGKARAGVESISRQLEVARNAFLSLQGAMGLQAGIRGLARLADEIQSVNARLRLAVASSREFASAQQMAYRVAAQTGAGYEAVATLYARLATTAKDYGLSQERIATVTGATALALKVSGASAAESSGAIRQFAQAIGAGVLRGDEFNSMMEQAPRLMKALADGLGLPIGKLRGLAEQGLLTTDVVVAAIESQRQAIEREAQAMPRTIGQSMSTVRDEFARTVDSLNQSTGATAAAGRAFDALARNMNAIVGAGAVAAVAALTAATTRAASAGAGYLASLISRVAAERAAIATSVEHARVRVAYAQAELASAQAAVAAAGGMARLSVVENTLIPAQQRLAAAQAGLNAAMAQGTIMARGLSAALALVGGPLGLIMTLLTAGATAWAIWGSRAQDAGKKAEAAVDRAREAVARLSREERFGAGDAADLREAIDLLEKRRAVLEETARVTYRGRPSDELQAELIKVGNDLAEFRLRLKQVEAREGTGAPGAPTEAGRALMRKQWDAYIAQFRDKSGQLDDALAELRARAKDAGIGEASAAFKKAEAAIRAKFAETRTGTHRAPGVDRAAIDAEFALLKDGLARQQAALDAALEDRLVSLRDYYARKTALEQQEIDAGIARAKTLLNDARRMQCEHTASFLSPAM